MRKTFTQIVEDFEALPEQEWFNLGVNTWDVAKAWRWIAAGVIDAEKDTMDIVGYAESILALDREHPEERRMSVFIAIDRGHVGKIKPGSPQYNAPGLVLNDPPSFAGSSLIIDGNHRLAARYMNGEDQMDFYIIDGALDKALQGITKLPPKKLRKK